MTKKVMTATQLANKLAKALFELYGIEIRYEGLGCGYSAVVEDGRRVYANTLPALADVCGLF